MKTCPMCSGYYGPDVHKDSDDRCICKPQPEPETFAPPEIRSSEWMDELAENLRAYSQLCIRNGETNVDHPGAWLNLGLCLRDLAKGIERRRESSSIIADKPHDE